MGICSYSQATSKKNTRMIGHLQNNLGNLQTVIHKKDKENTDTSHQITRRHGKRLSNPNSS